MRTASTSTPQERVSLPHTFTTITHQTCRDLMHHTYSQASCKICITVFRASNQGSLQDSLTKHFMHDPSRLWSSLSSVLGPQAARRFVCRRWEEDELWWSVCGLTCRPQQRGHRPNTLHTQRWDNDTALHALPLCIRLSLVVVLVQVLVIVDKVNRRCKNQWSDNRSDSLMINGINRGNEVFK